MYQRERKNLILDFYNMITFLYNKNNLFQGISKKITPNFEKEKHQENIDVIQRIPEEQKLSH